MAESVLIVNGPLFNGRAEAAIESFLAETVQQVANTGVNDVKAVLDAVLQKPTGNYERHIVTERQQNDVAVTDSQIIYGPWLEGVGSRNRTTKFKGYFTFRKTTQTLAGKVPSIADTVLKKFISGMN